MPAYLQEERHGDPRAAHGHEGEAADHQRSPAKPLDGEALQATQREGGRVAVLLSLRLIYAWALDTCDFPHRGLNDVKIVAQLFLCHFLVVVGRRHCCGAMRLGGFLTSQ